MLYFAFKILIQSSNICKIIAPVGVIGVNLGSFSPVRVPNYILSHGTGSVFPTIYSVHYRRNYFTGTYTICVISTASDIFLPLKENFGTNCNLLTKISNFFGKNNLTKMDTKHEKFNESCPKYKVWLYNFMQIILTFISLS